MEFLNETTYVDQAESVIKEIYSSSGKKNNKDSESITSSKLRNILSLAADIYDKAISDRSTTFSEELRGRVEYLRIRVVYEAGRDNKVRLFIDKANLIGYLKLIGSDKTRYTLFYHYLEALVAFHKYYETKNN